MMINFSSNRKNKGIGLLELMLSLAIIAILLIMATRYYLVTSRSQKTDEGVSLVNSLIAGAEDFRGDQPTFKNLKNIGQLISQGSIAASYKLDETSATTPWGEGSTISITNYGSDQSQVQITFTGIPATACNALANKFVDNGGVCSAAGKSTGIGNFTLTYPQTTKTPTP